jgi:hypothetical protein
VPVTKPTPTRNCEARRAAAGGFGKQGDGLPRGLVRAWRGTQVSAQLYRIRSVEPVEFRLSVRRHDGRQLHEHWNTLQRVKEFCCPGRRAFEAYPLPDAVVDEAPMWHLWVLFEGVSLGVVLNGKRS